MEIAEFKDPIAERLEQAERDIVFLINHPMQACLACYYSPTCRAQINGGHCSPVWRGHYGDVKEIESQKDP